ncbi:MAG: hypothetical protein ABWK01_07440 [Infirmifilum sp.]
MPLRIDESRVLYSIPKARSIRELGRLAGVSHSTAKRVVDDLSSRGSFLIVVDDEYFGFTHVVFIAPFKRVPGSLPYGSRMALSASSPGGYYIIVVGYVPAALSSLYVKGLQEALGKGEVLVTSEVTYWVPLERLRNLRQGEVDVLAEKLEDFLPRFKKPEKNRMPDAIDLELLTGKLMFGPYARAWEIIKKLSHLLWHPLPSYQSVSYHYRLHFYPGWLYTTYHEKRDPSKAPKVALLLKGREAGRVAKALASLPVWGVAYTAKRAAVYLGQLEVGYLQAAYDLAHSYGVKVQDGLMLVKNEVDLGVPHLWRFLDDETKKWVWVRDRVRVPVYL